jgi:hypothetical protein
MSWENLQLAFCKAARGRRDRPAVQRFADDLEKELSRMMRGLIQGDYPVGRFCQFVIYDPKERVITAPCFGERVLHHALMNVLEPVLEPSAAVKAADRKPRAGEVEELAARILDLIGPKPLYYAEVIDAFPGYPLQSITRAFGKLHVDEKLWQDPEGRMCVRGSVFAAKVPGGR